MRSNTLSNEDVQALELLSGSNGAAVAVANASDGQPGSKPTVNLDELTKEADRQ